MTPQLFINYKLETVAHLPWRMLTSKAPNTFIDDLFTFVLKMSMLYGYFRDSEKITTHFVMIILYQLYYIFKRA
jgi:hypothetical protein